MQRQANSGKGMQIQAGRQAKRGKGRQRQARQANIWVYMLFERDGTARNNEQHFCSHEEF